MREIALYRMGCIGVLLLLGRSSWADEVAMPPRSEAARERYAQLLALFPEERQSYGIDHFKNFTGDQPMTLGLVVSAEAIHYRNAPNDESRRRVVKGVQWLLDNRDLDQDGAPGWGLPQPWDAGSDGTENPANHPYTITTAIVVTGFLDALENGSIWSQEQKAEIHDLIAAVMRRWCSKVWSDGYGGGYFWYSPRSEDDFFAVNSPAMFLASMTRFLAEHGDSLKEEDKSLFMARRDAMIKAILSTVERRHDLPFWMYAPSRPANTHDNDLLHHVYTLWGIETYRDAKGPVEIPWTRAESLQSVDKFWRDGRLLEHSLESSEKSDRGARLWGAGMALAFYAKWADAKQSEACFQAIHAHYGDWPNLRAYPDSKQLKQPFDRRHASHLLYGLSIYCY